MLTRDRGDANGPDVDAGFVFVERVGADPLQGSGRTRTASEREVAIAEQHLAVVQLGIELV